MGGNEEAERANDGDDEDDVPERAVPVGISPRNIPTDTLPRNIPTAKVSLNIPTAKVRRNIPTPLFSRNVSEDRSIGIIRGDTDEQFIEDVFLADIESNHEIIHFCYLGHSLQYLLISVFGGFTIKFAYYQGLTEMNSKVRRVYIKCGIGHAQRKAKDRT
ncbi:hypothetical protein F2Q69_00051160 [Brassica cretica]|uniref:Uncharacterized protein n=1 Tax=Brassica cretica TaxID=69181 RepID=A0A8S9PRZ7_BRACR|nr:hypothetical protein F2Q69_00051160 [Brassica cretica]